MRPPSKEMVSCSNKALCFVQKYKTSHKSKHKIQDFCHKSKHKNADSCNKSKYKNDGFDSCNKSKYKNDGFYHKSKDTEVHNACKRTITIKLTTKWQGWGFAGCEADETRFRAVYTAFADGGRAWRKRGEYVASKRWASVVVKLQKGSVKIEGRQQMTTMAKPP